MQRISNMAVTDAELAAFIVSAQMLFPSAFHTVRASPGMSSVDLHLHGRYGGTLARALDPEKARYIATILNMAEAVGHELQKRRQAETSNDARRPGGGRTGAAERSTRGCEVVTVTAGDPRCDAVKKDGSRCTHRGTISTVVGGSKYVVCGKHAKAGSARLQRWR